MAETQDIKAAENFISAVRKRFDWCATSERPQRKVSLEDRQFLRGRLEDHWPPEVIARRQQSGQPCHVINRGPQLVNVVTNAQRQNRASAKVSPVDDKGDIKVAEIIQGGIRHIEYISKAEIVYGTAGADAGKSGLGYWTLETVRNNPRSFDQDIRLVRVRNPFTIYLDPNAQEPDGSDAEFGFKITTMSEDEFKAAFKGKECPSGDEWETWSLNYPGWYENKQIRIAEYYYKDTHDDVLYALTDGSFKLKSELTEEPAKESIIDQIDTKISIVKWCKLTGKEKLEETRLPGSGKWIPIVRVVGEELDVNGEVTYAGVIRHAKDAQREFNYMRSARTKAIGLAPTAPYMMAEGQQEGHENEFQSANLTDPAYLLYKPVDLNGNLAPPPRRESADPPVQALTLACRDAADDMKATTGVYDAQQGATSNETSGRAINARINQGETSNFHFVDNLTLAIGHSARIILDWFPDVYDTKRTMRIIGEDDTHSVVTIVGKSYPEELKAKLPIYGRTDQAQEGQKPVYDISVGEYDVICSAGPSFATKRQQASEQLIDLARVWPALLQFAPDLLANSLDVPYAKEIAERAKKTLPPGLQDNPEGTPELPPEVQQKMAAMEQEKQVMVQELNALSQQVETKAHELASRERINSENNDVKIMLAEIAANNSGAMELMKNEFQMIHAALAAANQPPPDASVGSAEPQGQPAA